MAPAPRRKATTPVTSVDDAPQKPFLRFYHSETLREKTLAVLLRLEQTDEPIEHASDLADVVIELMNSGMDYFFMQPLKESKAGFILQQSANLGLVGAQQLIGSVIRKILLRMDGAQLVSVSGSIRRLMV
ncbi:hypothetical protein GCM10025771_06350 [Niveibacterium umoris]|uniref:Uncharacterized protein n=1 Tax=Niveibacterium umoris TaxID=1193620 RepID=A0A840BQK9_9RHOO|nr:hypothetical protein [Niveibacterium umoris]MBB4013818.1 hypothetical protein [Niveibacterium umoris]